MSKLLLKFTNKILSVTELEHVKNIVIGRDADCDIRINSIRCGPVHATITHHDGGGYQITSVDEEHFPLQVNHKPVGKQHLFTQGDVMYFGDFTLAFIDSSQVYQEQRHESDDNEGDDNRLWSMKIAEKVPAFVQIMNGQKMGRIIKLTKEFTPLGRKENKCAVINLRNNRYYLSPLEDKCSQLLLNGKPLIEGDIELKGGDLIQIDGLKIEFQQDK